MSYAESCVVKEVWLSRNKAGGSAAENVDIEIPEHARAFQYLLILEGTGNAVQNSIRFRGVYNDGTVNVAQQLTSAIATQTTTNAASGNLVNVSGNFIRWTVQANAATANEFGLHLKFLSL